MNLYNLLDLDQSASNKDIKKSYRYFAKLYHPDKHKNNKDYYENKFKEISFAYEILGNKDSRYEYDLSLETNDTPFNLLMKIFSKNKFYDKIINNELVLEILTKMYGDPKEIFLKIKENINNFDFLEIYNIFNESKKKLDIIYNLKLDLDDIYDIKSKELVIKRLINNNFIEENIIVPLDPYTEELTYEGKGDSINGNIGNVIIKFSLKNNDFYEILDNYNLLIKTKYFNIINLPNSNLIQKKDGKKVFDCEKFVIYKYNNQGLFDLNLNNRGDLYIKNIY